jgi:formylglycine-generating enzyme required for sulfatase activity/outer membrane protein assembly factor BamB
MRRGRLALVVLVFALALALVVARCLKSPTTVPAAAKRHDRCALAAAPMRPTPHAGWRGDGTGVYSDVRPPLHWSPSENVAWKTPLPSWGNATPVIAGDRLFVTAEPDWLLAIRISDGHILWRQEVRVLDALSPDERKTAEQLLHDAIGVEDRIRAAEGELARLKRQGRGKTPPDPARVAALARDIEGLRQLQSRVVPFETPTEWPTVGNASATPVTDGKTVYVAFSTFVVAAFDLEGNRLWARLLPYAESRKQAGGTLQIGGSPVLVGGVLVMPMVDLLGLDPRTGRTLWKGPTYAHFGSPVAVDGTDLVVTAGGDVVCAADGTVLTEGHRKEQLSAPVVHRNTAFLMGLDTADPPKATAEAVLLPPETADPFVPQTLWKSTVGTAQYWASPVLAAGALVDVDSERHLYSVDVLRGTVGPSGVLATQGEAVSASPALVGNRLYFETEDATTIVTQATPPFAELARNTLSTSFEQLRSSPVFSGSRLFLRTTRALYCISEDPADRVQTTPVDDAAPAPGLDSAPPRRAPAPMKFEPKSLLEFVRLSGGRFRFGCEPQDSLCAHNKDDWRTPGPFWLGRTAVTVAAYKRCVTAGACRAPAPGDSCNWGLAGRENHPVNCVDWDQATKFCAWIGGRLPTAEEWEYAAKGGTSRLFPWGDTPPDETHARFGRSPDAGTCAADANPAGATVDGLLNMVGNVRQWTSTIPAGAGADRRELRGGSYTLDGPGLRTWVHEDVSTSFHSEGVGFRCAL